MLCQGGGFEVKKGDNYNFSRDFSIAMTFSVVRRQHEQGLLYKGTGSDNTTPAARDVVSRRRERRARDAAVHRRRRPRKPALRRPARSRRTTSSSSSSSRRRRRPSAGADTADPYPPPFDTDRPRNHRRQRHVRPRVGLPVGRRTIITISKIAPAGRAPIRDRCKFLDSIKNGTPKAYDVTISVREVHTDGTLRRLDVRADDADRRQRLRACRSSRPASRIS